MSEYQYYEFRAIDRPLDDRQMQKLRAVSSRAVITPTSFVNEYNWGDLKGDPNEWMEKYFDAFLYFANWGTRRFMLRFPKRLFDAECASKYCIGDSAFVKAKENFVVLSFESDYEDDDWIESEGWLSSMVPLRSEIMRGDLRCLYLAWLLCVQNGELDDDELEPSVPANLDELSVSERSFADFLGIDRDLIEVAAQKSPRSSPGDENRKALESWVCGMSEEEKNSILVRLLDGETQLGEELRIRFVREETSRNLTEIQEKRRTAGELYEAAEALSEEKRRQAAEQAAAEKARKEEEMAAARDKYLKSLSGKENEIWFKIESLISTKQPARYDEAVGLLVDLRDLAEHRGKTADFLSRYRELCRKHERKASLLRKMHREI